MNSSTLLKSAGDRWKKTHDYLCRIITAWAHLCGAKEVDRPGDEIILAFLNPKDAFAFAVAATVHVNEIADSINYVRAFQSTVGVRGRIAAGSASCDSYGTVLSSGVNCFKFVPKEDGIVIDESALPDMVLTHFNSTDQKPITIQPSQYFSSLVPPLLGLPRK